MILNYALSVLAGTFAAGVGERLIPGVFRIGMSRPKRPSRD